MSTKIVNTSEIKKVKSQLEVPPKFGFSTPRSLCSHDPDNQEIVKKLNALKGVWEVIGDDKFDKCVQNLFGDDFKGLEIDELKKELTELVIRFDTSPRNLTKTDYDHLMRVLCAALLHLYTTSAWDSVNLTSSNEDVLTIEKNGDGAEWQPHVGNLAVETTQHEAMNQQNEKQLATVGNIRDYINNRLSWIDK